MNSTSVYVESDESARWGALRLPGAIALIIENWAYTVKG